MKIFSKEIIAYAAFFGIGLAGSAYLHSLYEKAESGSMCYYTFSHIEFMGSAPGYGRNSAREEFYVSVRPFLKNVAKDKKITNKECSELNDIFDRAQDIGREEEKLKSLQID